jgi:DNA-binding IclR family transcriptional regulator
MMGYVEEELPAHSVIERVVQLLGHCAAEGPVSLGVLARRCRMPKSTVHRIVAELCAHGMVTRTGTGYGLGARLVEWARRSDTDLPCDVLVGLVPHLLALYEATPGVVSLGVLRGCDVRCLEMYYRSRDLPVVRRLRTRVPAYCSALGKVLLAYEPDGLSRYADLPGGTEWTVTRSEEMSRQLAVIRASGVAVVWQEQYAGLVAVAAAVARGGSPPLAAIAVTGPATGFDLGRAERQVRIAACAASRAIRLSC